MKKFLLVLALLAPFSAVAELDVVDAWIKNLPPSVPVRAGYMTIYNTGDSEVRILSVSSEAFASVEIHRSYMEDGMMRMEPVESLGIAPGASLQLAPGGYHLMMMQPTEPTKPGQAIGIVLKLDDGSSKQLMMTVVK